MELLVRVLAECLSPVEEELAVFALENLVFVLSCRHAPAPTSPLTLLPPSLPPPTLSASLLPLSPSASLLPPSTV